MDFWLRILVGIVTAVLGFVTFAGWLAFFSERPPNTTDPHVLAGDGGQVNYCVKPELKGQGKLARDIPKANTPGCSYSHFPLPVLSECTEPLVEGAGDLRGLWKSVDGIAGHVERIEQCGSRVVVTTAGIIHDLGPNSTGGLTSNDTEGSVTFLIGEQEYCPRTSAGIEWNDGVLNFRVFGWGPVVVKRYMDGDNLIWEYADGSVTRMERLCELPEEHRVPAPRGGKYPL